MLPFRTEIRNSPNHQSLKIYIKDTSCDKECKELLKDINGIQSIEIQESFSRNRVEENITIYAEEGTNINVLQKLVENKLDNHFAYD